MKNTLLKKALCLAVTVMMLFCLTFPALAVTSAETSGFIKLYKTVVDKGSELGIGDWMLNNDYVSDIISGITFEIFKTDKTGANPEKAEDAIGRIDALTSQVTFFNVVTGLPYEFAPDWYLVREVLGADAAVYFEEADDQLIYFNGKSVTANAGPEFNVVTTFEITQYKEDTHSLQALYDNKDGTEMIGYLRNSPPLDVDPPPNNGGGALGTSRFTAMQDSGTVFDSFCADIGALGVKGTYNVDPGNHGLSDASILNLVAALDYIYAMDGSFFNTAYDRTALAQLVVWNIILTYSDDPMIADLWLREISTGLRYKDAWGNLFKIEGFNHESGKGNWYTPAYKDLIDDILANPEKYVIIYEARVAAGDVSFVGGVVFLVGDGNTHSYLQQRQVIMWHSNPVTLKNKPKAAPPPIDLTVKKIVKAPENSSWMNLTFDFLLSLSKPGAAETPLDYMDKIDSQREKVQGEIDMLQSQLDEIDGKLSPAGEDLMGVMGGAALIIGDDQADDGGTDGIATNNNQTDDSDTNDSVTDDSVTDDSVNGSGEIGGASVQYEVMNTPPDINPSPIPQTAKTGSEGPLPIATTSSTVLDDDTREALAADRDALLDKIEKLTGILDKLNELKYVDFNEEYDITHEEDGIAVMAEIGYTLALDSQVSGAELTPIGNCVYSFSLADGKQIDISNLPEGVKYTVREVFPTGAPEELIKVTAEFAGQSEPTETYTVNSEIGETGLGNIVRFTNYFEDWKDAGKSLRIRKVWRNAPNVDWIEILLYKDDRNPETIRIPKENALAGNSMTWEYIYGDVDVGATYKIVERVPNGYTANYIKDSVTVTDESTDEMLLLTVENSISDSGQREDPNPFFGPDPTPTPTPDIDIPEYNPPLVEFPPEPDVNNPEEVIIDDPIPLAGVPQTADPSLGVVQGLFGTAMLGVVMLQKKNKKK